MAGTALAVVAGVEGQHSLRWLARHALLSELGAQVQQGWFEDGRSNMRSWPHSWLGAGQQAVLGQQAPPGSQTRSIHG